MTEDNIHQFSLYPEVRKDHCGNCLNVFTQPY